MTGFPSFYAWTISLDFRNFKLTQPIDYYANDGRHFRLIEGTPSDLASIPRPLWALLPPFGQYALPAYFHDGFYQNHALLVAADGTTTIANLTKEDSDSMLKEMMICAGVDTITVETIYEGVNLGGASAYKSDRS